MTPQTIDDELRQALTVDPSPEFVARVRTRIAAEPAPARWGFWWVAIGGIGVLAVIVVAVVAPRRTIVTEPRLGSRTAKPIGALVRGPERPALREIERLALHETGVVRPFKGRDAAVEILVDQREATTLRRLMSGAPSGRVDLKPLLKPSPLAITEPAPVNALAIPGIPAIEEIVIDPLPTGSEGARQ